AFAGNLDQKIGLDLLGIPGTNGDGVPGEAGSFYGGMPRMRFDAGFGNLGYQATSPFLGHDYQHQIAVNGNWTKGNHDVRFGSDVFIIQINQQVANFPGGDAPAGGFRFRSNTTSRTGTKTSDFNAIASFMLGLPREAARNFLTGSSLQTRSRQYSLYIRDRWQVKPNLTLSYGTRWEYYPFPVRPDRGLERFDALTNEMLVCGIGSVPRNCDLPQSKKLFAPRVGIAWRMSDTFVMRAGYGITYDPFNLGRDLRGNLPTQFSQKLAVPNSRSYSTTLEDGFPDIPPIPVEERIPMPKNANVATADENYRRGYIQSWNFTLEKQFGDWIGSAGYVATRSVRQSARLEQNWSPIGTGSGGRVLRKLTGRTANTLVWGVLGTPKYDALQMRMTRRSAGGHQFSLAYTWSHGRGYTSESSTAQPRVRHPLYYDRNYGSLNQDRRHNMVISNAYELPFGPGKRFASSGPAAWILGGWQINGLASLRTGRPSTVTAPTGSLNSQGSGQFAD
ncbi:MAG: TonB-dependent receptor, partial [bacterium]|nr:TonB-dependent receptor [bacterium]